MSLQCIFNYEINEPNSLPAYKDETLPTAREIVNLSPISKTLCFDLCTSKIPQI